MAQFPALTALRFLAALLVFLFHFSPRGTLWDVLAGQGHIGVNIFFVLSGFLITLRYADRVVRRDVSLRDYFVRRIARIVPLYYAVFVLSSYFGGGGVPLHWDRLPEWTLTQGLFSPSLDHLVVAASWSLTVEECFYALAPALFLLLAATARRAPRRPLAASGFVLLGLTLALYGIGALLWTTLDGTELGFLNGSRTVLLHTLFGRFYEFAIGIFAALLLRRGSKAGAGAWATVLSVVVLLACERGMDVLGGLLGSQWYAVWLVNLVVAPAAALLILSLASAANPLARAFGAAPFVYLGQVSYAVYLVQMTPIGKGLFYPFLPRDPLLACAVLYLGVTAVSIVLYELVEEPARRFVVRMAGVEPSAGEDPPPRSRRVRGAVAATVAAILTIQGAFWALDSRQRREGPPTLEELRAAGPSADDVFAPDGSSFRADGPLSLVRLPPEWREGAGLRDERAPGELAVFDGAQRIPFSRRETSRPGAAFFRGPRLGSLALRVTETPRDLVVVRQTPWLLGRVAAERLRRGPAACALLLLGFALALALAYRVQLVPALTPSRLLAVALPLSILWCAFERHRPAWAPGWLALEWTALAALALTARARPGASAPPPHDRDGSSGRTSPEPAAASEN